MIESSCNLRSGVVGRADPPRRDADEAKRDSSGGVQDGEQGRPAGEPGVVSDANLVSSGIASGVEVGQAQVPGQQGATVVGSDGPIVDAVCVAEAVNVDKVLTLSSVIGEVEAKSELSVSVQPSDVLMVCPVIGQAGDISTMTPVIGVNGSWLGAKAEDQPSSVEGAGSIQVETLVCVARDGDTILAVMLDSTVGAMVPCSGAIDWGSVLQYLESRAAEREAEAVRMRQEFEERMELRKEVHRVEKDEREAAVGVLREEARVNMQKPKLMDQKYAREIIRMEKEVRHNNGLVVSIVSDQAATGTLVRPLNKRLGVLERGTGEFVPKL